LLPVDGSRRLADLLSNTLVSTPAPETTYCPVLTFRGDRRDLILMLRLEEQNEEIATLLLPSKSIVTFRRVGCQTCSCVHAASALFVELSHPPLQRAMRGPEEYESLRELEFGIRQKGNSRSGQQLLSVNVLSYPHLTNLLTPWSRVLLEKLTGFQIVKK